MFRSISFVSQIVIFCVEGSFFTAGAQGIGCQLSPPWGAAAYLTVTGCTLSVVVLFLWDGAIDVGSSQNFVELCLIFPVNKNRINAACSAIQGAGVLIKSFL